MTTTQRPPIVAQTHRHFKLQPFRANPAPSLAFAIETLSFVLGPAEQSEIPYYVHAGTALGMHRDGGFMVHDTDIDIALNLDWNDRQEANNVLHQIFGRLQDGGFDLARTIRIGDRYSQLIFLDCANDETLVDVELYYAGVEDDVHIHYKEEGVIRIPSEVLSSIQTRRFQGVGIPMPARIEDYLAARYGSDWRTPVSDLHWHRLTPALTLYE